MEPSWLSFDGLVVGLQQTNLSLDHIDQDNPEEMRYWGYLLGERDDYIEGMKAYRRCDGV